MMSDSAVRDWSIRARRECLKFQRQWVTEKRLFGGD